MEPLNVLIKNSKLAINWNLKVCNGTPLCVRAHNSENHTDNAIGWQPRLGANFRQLRSPVGGGIYWLHFFVREAFTRAKLTTMVNRCIQRCMQRCFTERREPVAASAARRSAIRG